MSALIPIVCLRCGSTGKVASVPLDLVCATCGTGEHLDLNERTAGLDPTDPMMLLPGGVPEEDFDVRLVNPGQVKTIPSVPGQTPYTDQALSTPVNASRKQADADTTQWYVVRSAPETSRGFADDFGPFASEAEADAAKPQDGNTWTTYPDRSEQDQASYERFMTSSRTAEYKYVEKRGDKWVVLQKGTGKVLSTHDSQEKAQSSFRAMEMSMHGSKVDQIVAAVRKANPQMSARTALRVAQQTVARYPVVKQASQDEYDQPALFPNTPMGLEPGTQINIGPLVSTNPNMSEAGYGDQVFEYVGPTRHPYSSVVRELDHGTTWHVSNDRITPVGSRRVRA